MIPPSGAGMPLEWTAFTMVAFTPATATVPPLFIWMTFSQPFCISQAPTSRIATAVAPELLHRVDRVPDVVEVAVGEEDRVERARVVVLRRTLGIPGEPGVDEDALALRGLPQPGAVAEPGHAVAAEVHLLLQAIGAEPPARPRGTGDSTLPRPRRPATGDPDAGGRARAHCVCNLSRAARRGGRRPALPGRTRLRRGPPGLREPARRRRPAGRRHARRWWPRARRSWRRGTSRRWSMR